MDILVDLDGTMIDPKAGIIGSLQFALRRLGCDVPAAATLHWVIGPSLRSTLAKLAVPAERIEDGIAAYREHYRGGAMFDFSVYDGIDAALAGLVQQGHRLIVATAKPHVFAKPILERAGLARYYAAVHGAELDGRNDDKADLIRHIIAVEGVATSNAVMIGDRMHDARAAKLNAMACIGVTWGYGSADELTAAGATALIAAPDALCSAIATLAARRA